MSRALSLLTLLIFLTIYQLTAQSSIGSGSSSDWQKEFVLAERLKKDSAFRMTESTPLLTEEVPSFTGLQYYPYNPAFCIKATFQRISDPVIIRMKTTTERRPEYRTYALASFILDGKHCQLMIYQAVEPGKQPGYEKYLFLPFTDETSGRETYGGGRFIELSIPGGDEILIDFNTAFNPYCAYNHRYSCPVPPEENDLSIKIEAGELLYNSKK